MSDDKIEYTKKDTNQIIDILKKCDSNLTNVKSDIEEAKNILDSVVGFNNLEKQLPANIKEAKRLVELCTTNTEYLINDILTKQKGIEDYSKSKEFSTNKETIAPTPILNSNTVNQQTVMVSIDNNFEKNRNLSAKFNKLLYEEIEADVEDLSLMMGMKPNE